MTTEEFQQLNFIEREKVSKYIAIISGKESETVLCLAHHFAFAARHDRLSLSPGLLAFRQFLCWVPVDYNKYINE